MFSYGDYKEILRIIKSTGRQANYGDALHRDQFIIMRHDVEYSVERAYALAKVESSMDFTSTFFFQWTNNSYNLLSRKNRDLICDMHERGQNIGLHFALNGITDMQEVRKQIVKEMHMLSEMLGFEISEFSVHRPSPSILAENIKLPGIINAYQDEFLLLRRTLRKTPSWRLNICPMLTIFGGMAIRMRKIYWGTIRYRS